MFFLSKIYKVNRIFLQLNLSATFFWSPVGSISGGGTKTFWPHFILQFEKENYICIESERGYIFITKHYCY